MSRTNILERVISASLSFFSPSLMAAYALPPAPSRVETDSTMVTIGKATVVAALPRYPTPWPMNIWSTILYNAFTTMEMTAGRANCRNNFGIGS